MIITCSACQKEYDQTSLHQRPAPQTGPDVTEFLLICPHCQAETHTHYVSPAIVRRQELVQVTKAHFEKRRNDTAWKRFKQAQADLQREFDKLNRPKVVV